MAKFNTTDRRHSTTAPLTVNPAPTTNHQGGTGYTRDAKSDLFLLATTSHDITAAAFYEGGSPAVTGQQRQMLTPDTQTALRTGGTDARVTRYVHLVRTVAAADPQWIYDFLVWLRTGGNIRTAAIVGAVEAAHALTAAGIPGARPLIDHVCQRADEPGEIIAYHHAVHGRNLPMPIKRGLADAVLRLYTERSLLKYDTATHGIRFADVLELTHPVVRSQPGRSLHDIALSRGVDPAEVALALESAADNLRTLALAGHPVRTRIDTPTIANLMRWESPRPIRAAGWRNEAAATALGMTPTELSALRSPTRREWQRDLFTYALNRRHGRADQVPVSLSTIIANRELRATWAASPADGRGILPHTDDLTRQISDAGMTWEDVLSTLGSKVDKARLWEALIPSMGYMALIRNLRNFDQAGVSDSVAQTAAARIADPDQVRQSRQLPLRFLSAFRAAPSLRWAWPLQQALDTAVENIPHLSGRTLILIDTSGSMDNHLSERSDLKRWDAAAVFGLALAGRCDHADVVSFSAPHPHAVIPNTASLRFPTTAGESLLSAALRFSESAFIGGGTDTVSALRRHYAGHDRVVILTDEQNGAHSVGQVTDQIPANRPLYTFNLAGYATSHAPTNPYRVTLGGLTDHMFTLVPLIESGRDAAWPWTPGPQPRQLGRKIPEDALIAVTRTMPSTTEAAGYMPNSDGPWHVSDGGWTGRTTGGTGR